MNDRDPSAQALVEAGIMIAILIGVAILAAFFT